MKFHQGKHKFLSNTSGLLGATAFLVAALASQGVNAQSPSAAGKINSSHSNIAGVIMNKQQINQATVAQRFVAAFGGNNAEGLRQVLDPNVVFYGTLAWGIKGSENLVNFASEFQKGLPGLNVVLHDEFYNAEGTRGNMRIHLHFSNTGVFMGNQPTGKSGVSVESFSMKIKDGKITELIQSGNTFPLAAIELIDFKMSYPTDTPDPHEAILSASPKQVLLLKPSAGQAQK